MFNGDCYPNGSYINHIYITPNISSYISHLQCVLSNSTLSGGEWVNPNGQHVNCTNSINNDPFLCDVSNTPANITVYRPGADNFTNLLSVVMSLSVVYPVVVLILIPTSSLFIYSVS